MIKQDPEPIQAILEGRARALARAPEAEDFGDSATLVVLALGSERYGVDIRHVQEVQPLGTLTPIPGLPPLWAGLVNLRSHLVPVLHLCRCLGLSEESAADGAPDRKVVLVSAAGLDVGLLVDDVPEVRRTLHSTIGAPMGESLGVRRDVLLGVTADLVSVLDLEALLGDSRLVVQDAVTPG